MSEPIDGLHPGSSHIQQAAESVMIGLLGEQLGATLTSGHLQLEDGVVVQVDGVSLDPPILVEAWARQGKPHGAQLHKIASDALKLSAAGPAIGPRTRLILLFADEQAAAPFRPGSWRGSAIRRLGIDVLLVEIPTELRNQITEAQRRQYR